MPAKSGASDGSGLPTKWTSAAGGPARMRTSPATDAMARGRRRMRSRIGKLPLEQTGDGIGRVGRSDRSEEHTSELQSLMRSSYAVFCLNKKNTNIQQTQHV